MKKDAAFTKLLVALLMVATMFAMYVAIGFFVDDYGGFTLAVYISLTGRFPMRSG